MNTFNDIEYLTMRTGSTLAPTVFTTRHKSAKAMTTTNIIAVLLSTLLLMTSSPTIAQKLSPSDAAESARNMTGGKVLKVKTPRSGSQDYRVKMLLPEGKVRSILIDGNSGKIKKRRKKQNK